MPPPTYRKNLFASHQPRLRDINIKAKVIDLLSFSLTLPTPRNHPSTPFQCSRVRDNSYPLLLRNSVKLLMQLCCYDAVTVPMKLYSVEHFAQKYRQISSVRSVGAADKLRALINIILLTILPDTRARNFARILFSVFSVHRDATFV